LSSGFSVKVSGKTHKVRSYISRRASGLAARTLDLGVAEYRRDRADDAFGYLILQIERVFERAVEAAKCLVFQ
jgi:hypothetical protein